jgi:ATP/maltotriose-dependent transcriptional regulator MalT
VAKKKSQEQVKQELAELTKPKTQAPPFDLKKSLVRVGLVVVVAWVLAGAVASFYRSSVPLIVAGVLTAGVVGVLIWASRLMKKQQALGAILQGADTAEGRKDALAKLDAEFKKGDAQASLARAQLEMQDDPAQALRTLEAVNLDKEMAPVAAQVRAMRAMIHLTQGDAQAARNLVEHLDLGKQQDVKMRAMFATVAGEAWARTGQAKKALDTLELFNPEDAENAELRPQMWRARAFAYAHLNDMKGVGRALKKLSDLNPNLLGPFIASKKIHPLLEREAKQLVMRSGLVPTKMQRQYR